MAVASDMHLAAAMERDTRGTDRRTHHKAAAVGVAIEVTLSNPFHLPSPECSVTIVSCTDCMGMFRRMCGKRSTKISAKRRVVSCFAQVRRRGHLHTMF